MGPGTVSLASQGTWCLCGFKLKAPLLVWILIYITQCWGLTQSTFLVFVTQNSTAVFPRVLFMKGTRFTEWFKIKQCCRKRCFQDLSFVVEGRVASLRCPGWHSLPSSVWWVPFLDLLCTKMPEIGFPHPSPPGAGEAISNPEKLVLVPCRFPRDSSSSSFSHPILWIGHFPVLDVALS